MYAYRTLFMEYKSRVNNNVVNCCSNICLNFQQKFVIHGQKRSEGVELLDVQ